MGNFKKVLSHDTGDWLLCCWDECERYGVESHKAVQRTVEDGERKTITYVFCSDRHKELFKNGHRRYGFVA